MKKIVYISIFLLVSIQGYSQKSLPNWMQKSGWVKFSSACKTLIDLGMNVNCNRPTYVTDSSFFKGNEKWKGEVTQMYFYKKTNSFTSYKIKIKEHKTGSGFSCNQIVKFRLSALREVKKGTYGLKKCK